MSRDGESSAPDPTGKTVWVSGASAPTSTR